MFEQIKGLTPEGAARLTALVEQCRPVLTAEGMEAVQAMLVEHAMSFLQAIVITRALLGWDETPLQVAIAAVETSEARATPAS